MAIQTAQIIADRRGRLVGIGLLTFSTFVFGFSNVLAKYLTAEYPIGEALLIRSGFALLLLWRSPYDAALWAATILLLVLHPLYGLAR